MQILPLGDIAILKAELAKPQYKGLSDGDAVNLLYTPTLIDNPASRGKVPAPTTMQSVMGCLSQKASIHAIAAFPALAELVDDIHGQDRSRIGAAGSLLLAAGLITQAEYAAIIALLTSTIDDPSWVATVPGPTPAFTLFGGKYWKTPSGGSTDSIQPDDVALARAS